MLCYIRKCIAKLKREDSKIPQSNISDIKRTHCIRILAYLNLFISSVTSEYSYTLTVSVTIALDPTINQATKTGFTNVRARTISLIADRIY